jgi:hypothetical protein
MRITDNTYRYLFFLVLFIVLSTLLYTIDTLSISYKEALNYFVNNSLLSILTNTSTYIFGQNDIALRLPFLIFYLLSIVLMYRITENFFNKSSDRLISITLFMLLPGLLSASVLVNSAIVVTFLTLLYIYYYKSVGKHPYFLFVLFLFVDNSFAIFFLALFFYSLNKKDNILLLLSLLFFGLSMGIYGFDTGGKPRGFLVDTFAIYASIFSPLLFIYFFYSIYRSGIKKDRSLIWYISVTSLIFSLLFSFRQRIYIEDYAPFVVIFLPYMVKIFLHTVRIRLPQFRYRHYYTAWAVLFILAINVLVTIFNKPLYIVLENPKKHFTYKYNFAKELAFELKANNINKIYGNQEDLMLRLKFYGLKKGDEYFVTTKEQYFYDMKIPIKYYGKTIVTAYIIKH